MNLAYRFRPCALGVTLLATALNISTAQALDLDIGIRIGDSDRHEAPVHRQPGPPDHAPAHGYRAKHQYRYYPGAEVYFDSERRVYFFLTGSAWQMSASLPVGMKAQLGEHVTIALDSDRPYTEHDAHKRLYPPGHMKKGHHEKERHKK